MSITRRSFLAIIGAALPGLSLARHIDDWDSDWYDEDMPEDFDLPVNYQADHQYITSERKIDGPAYVHGLVLFPCVGLDYYEAKLLRPDGAAILSVFHMGRQSIPTSWMPLPDCQIVVKSDSFVSLDVPDDGGISTAIHYRKVMA